MELRREFSLREQISVAPAKELRLSLALHPPPVVPVGAQGITTLGKVLSKCRQFVEIVKD